MRLLLLLSLLLCIAEANAATPTLGTDCGAGATITGSKNAGKVTIGADTIGCTLTFPAWPKVPSCSAMLESNVFVTVNPSPLGTVTTTNTLFISDKSNNVPSLIEGDVVSYLCVGQ